ncbi:anti-sigma factor domain-containing protein [Litorivivens sp.]|uniref:anti-sigma factor n=1 Tax=Litorivivens sp. TaxID=2020868 RepID=UPI00356677A6
MNYLREEVLEGLAQRYVVGTMSYRARRRFAQVLYDEPTVRDKVLAWEERLSPLALSLDPVHPSQLLWQRILREINRYPKTERAAWKQYASTATAALLVAAVGISSMGWWRAANQPPQKVVETVVKTVVEKVVEVVPDPAAVSVIVDGADTIWVARIYEKLARIDIEVQTAPEEHTDKDYELWALQADGTPYSLGLLPKNGQSTIELDSIAIAALEQSDKLAVSLEPLGGSPELAPTGPVLFVSPVLEPHS